MNVTLVYFSPTGTTKKVLKMLADDLPAQAVEYDITVEENPHTFDEHELVLLGIPVYSGRVPMLAGKPIAALKGHNTPIVLVATFGNRHYDDSLLELKNIVQGNGFCVIAAAAFVTEHSVVSKFGKGRPDEKDIQEIHRFTSLIKAKMESGVGYAHSGLNIKGNPEYRHYNRIPMKPHTTKKCVKCGLCAKNCPAKAIPLELPGMTNKELGVTCMRCIRYCPKKARKFYGIEKFAMKKRLEKLCKGYRLPEIFV